MAALMPHRSTKLPVATTVTLTAPVVGLVEVALAAAELKFWAAWLRYQDIRIKGQCYKQYALNAYAGK
jgi:hypothetical protein